jgi:hypothetical protein
MSKEQPEPDKVVTVSDDELRASFNGPAVHSNKMFMTMTSSGARIAFMEALGDKVFPTFRAAVLLSFGDALALRDLLTRQLKDIEPQIKAAEAEARAQAAAKIAGD